MIYIRRVVNHSMEPSLQHGQLSVFVKRRAYRPGDIVIVKTGGRDLVKRIANIDGLSVSLRGDNRAESTDSVVSRPDLRGSLILPRRS